MKFHSVKFVYILNEFSNLVLKIKSSHVILGWGVVFPKSDSSEFEDSIAAFQSLSFIKRANPSTYF